MTVAEAITKAGEMRPNEVPTPHLTAELLRLDAGFARMTGVPVPTDTSTSRVLLLTTPDCEIYVDYLCACIDREMGDSALYVMDKETFELSLSFIRAAWRRDNTPADPGQWAVDPRGNAAQEGSLWA